MSSTQTIEINGAQISCADSGPSDGVPVVLIHSLFFDHTMFDPLTALLVDAGHRVVAYDLRGQGASSRAADDTLDMDTHTLDAAALIERLDLGRVHVLGNSMGGFVSLRLAARRPDLLLSAVAAGSSAEEEHQLAEFSPLVDALGQAGGADLIDTLMYIMFGDSSLSEPDETVLAWRTKMMALGTDIADSAHEVIHRQRIVEELAGCTVPVLAIAGSEDHAYPPPISDANIAEATGGRAVTIGSAGHSVTLEKPADTAKFLLQFFAEVSAD